MGNRYGLVDKIERSVNKFKLNNPIKNNDAGAGESDQGTLAEYLGTANSNPKKLEAAIAQYMDVIKADGLLAIGATKPDAQAAFETAIEQRKKTDFQEIKQSIIAFQEGKPLRGNDGTFKKTELEDKINEAKAKSETWAKQKAEELKVNPDAGASNNISSGAILESIRTSREEFEKAIETQTKEAQALAINPTIPRSTYIQKTNLMKDRAQVLKGELMTSAESIAQGIGEYQAFVSKQDIALDQAISKRTMYKTFFSSIGAVFAEIPAFGTVVGIVNTAIEAVFNSWIKNLEDQTSVASFKESLNTALDTVQKAKTRLSQKLDIEYKKLTDAIDRGIRELESVKEENPTAEQNPDITLPDSPTPVMPDDEDTAQDGPKPILPEAEESVNGDFAKALKDAGYSLDRLEDRIQRNITEYYNAKTPEIKGNGDYQQIESARAQFLKDLEAIATQMLQTCKKEIQKLTTLSETTIKNKANEVIEGSKYTDLKNQALEEAMKIANGDQPAAGAGDINRNAVLKSISTSRERYAATVALKSQEINKMSVDATMAVQTYITRTNQIGEDAKKLKDALALTAEELADEILKQQSAVSAHDIKQETIISKLQLGKDFASSISGFTATVKEFTNVGKVVDLAVKGVFDSLIAYFNDQANVPSFVASMKKAVDLVRGAVSNLKVDLNSEYDALTGIIEQGRRNLERIHDDNPDVEQLPGETRPDDPAQPGDGSGDTDTEQEGENNQESASTPIKNVSKDGYFAKNLPKIKPSGTTLANVQEKTDKHLDKLHSDNKANVTGDGQHIDAALEYFNEQIAERKRHDIAKVEEKIVTIQEGRPKLDNGNVPQIRISDVTNAITEVQNASTEWVKTVVEQAKKYAAGEGTPTKPNGQLDRNAIIKTINTFRDKYAKAITDHVTDINKMSENTDYTTTSLIAVTHGIENEASEYSRALINAAERLEEGVAAQFDAVNGANVKLEAAISKIAETKSYFDGIVSITKSFGPSEDDLKEDKILTDNGLEGTVSAKQKKIFVDIVEPINSSISGMFNSINAFCSDQTSVTSLKNALKTAKELVTESVDSLIGELENEYNILTNKMEEARKNIDKIRKEQAANAPGDDPNAPGDGSSVSDDDSTVTGDDSSTTGDDSSTTGDDPDAPDTGKADEIDKTYTQKLNTQNDKFKVEINGKEPASKHQTRVDIMKVLAQNWKKALDAESIQPTSAYKKYQDEVDATVAYWDSVKGDYDSWKALVEKAKTGLSSEEVNDFITLSQKFKR
ncbi:MAG: hypothetical protein AB8E82_15045 [Aureispira sp.]